MKALSASALSKDRRASCLREDVVGKPCNAILCSGFCEGVIRSAYRLRASAQRRYLDDMLAMKSTSALRSAP